MANPWQATLTVKDNKNKVSFINIYIEYNNSDIGGTNSWENAENAILDLLPVIDNMINGQITRTAISREITLPGGLKAMPGSTADVEEKGVFIFSTNASRPEVTIPTFKDSLVITGSDKINQSDTDVALFIFMMIDGSGTALNFVHPSDNRDTEIVSFIDAYERFRKSGK